MSQQSLLNNYWKYFPGADPNMPDAHKWENLQRMAESQGIDLPEYQEPTQYIYEAQGQLDNDFKANLKNKIESNQEYMPEALKGNYTPSGINSVLTDWSLANQYAESGDPLGLGSDDYYKYVYNNSMAGLWYKSNYGEDRYQYTDEDYEPSTFAHITGFFTSLASPLDLASLAAGGGVGKVATKGVTRGLLNKWGKETVEEIAENQLKKKVGVYNVARGSTEMGANLATFSGAHAALGSAANQMEEKGDIDYSQVMWDAGSAALESGLVGAATGGIVRGPMATQYAFSKLAKNPGLKENIVKLSTHPVSQLGVEGLAFTTIPHLLAETGLPTFTAPAFSDEQFTWDDYLKGLVTNYGIIGSMKAFSAIGAPRDRDIIDIVKTSYEIERASSARENKHLQSVRDNLLKEGIDPGDIVKEITDRNIKERGYIEEQEYLIPVIKQLQEYSKKGFNNLTEAEKVFVLKYGVIGDGSIAITRSINDFLRDKDTYFEGLENVLSKKHGRKVKLTEDEKAVWESEMKTTYEAYMHLKEQANAASIGREVMWDKPWVKEDAQIIFAKNDMGQAKYWVKTKDKNQHLFEKLEFETKEQAQSYLDKWYDTMEGTVGKDWMVQKSGKEAEITETSISDIKSRLDKSILEKIEESKKVVETEGLETSTESALRTARAGETVKMGYVNPETGQPLYTTGKGNQFITIDVPMGEVEAFRTRGYKPEAEIRETLGGSGVSYEPGKVPAGPAGQTVRVDYTRIARETAKEIKTEKERVERADYTKAEEKLVDAEITEQQSKGLQLKDIPDGPYKEIISYGPNRKLWEGLSNGSEGRKFVLDVHEKSPKATGQALKLSEFIENKLRKSFNEITVEDLNQFFYEKNIKLQKSMYKQLNIPYNPERPVYRNIIEASSFTNFTNAKIAIHNLYGGKYGQGVVWSNKAKNQIEKIQDLFKIIDRQVNETADIRGHLAPPESKVRRNTLSIGKKLTEKTGNEGYNLVSELGSKYLIRKQEINNLTKNFKGDNNPVKIDKKSGEYYLHMTEGFKKPKTHNRIVYLEKPMGEALQKYISDGRSLEGLHSGVSKELVKMGATKNREQIAFNDLRIRSQNLYTDAKSTIENLKRFNYFMGHDISKIDKYYLTKKPSEIIADQKGFHEAINRNLPGYTPEKALYKRTISGKAPSVTDAKFNNFLQQQIKKNKGAKVNITAEELNYAGRYAGGVIDIVLGKADYKTWFHENAHALQDYIYSVGDKSLIKLWESAEGRFKKDAKDKGYFKKYKDSKEAMDEFMADTISSWALKQQMPKSLSQRISNFVKRIYSKTKQALFGKEALNEKDLVRILGEDVWKGFERGDVKYRDMERFQMVDLPSYEKNVRKLFKQTMNKGLSEGQKFNRQNWNELKTLVAEAAGIEKPGEFQFAHAKIEELANFKDALRFFKGGREVLAVQRVTEIQDKYRVNQARVRAGITDAEQVNILKAIGVKDGKMDSASEFEFKVYKEFVGRQPEKNPKGYNKSLEEDISTNILTKGGFNFIAKKASDLGVMPTFAVIEQLGLKKVSSRLHDHMSMELDNSRPYFKLEEFAANRIGKRAWEGGIGKKEGARDALWTVDHARYIERRNENLLTRNEKKFVKKAFKEEYVNAKEPIEGNLDKYIRRTNEGNIVLEYNKATEKVKSMFHSTLKSLMNKAEYEQWLKVNDVKWIEDGTFFTRSLSKEYREHANPSGKAMEKLIREEAEIIEKRLIEKEPKNKKITDKRYEEIVDAAYSEAEAKFIEANQFGSIKFNSPHLLSRGKKLPETMFIPELGKSINVYETKWENSGKKYFLSMAKLLANMEFFPEYVSIKGAKFPGVKTAISKLGRMSSKGKQYESFVNKAIEKQLGISEIGSPFDLAASFGERAASFLAKTQLSAPTSGFKNLILGSQMTVSTFGFKDFISGVLKAIDRDNRHDIKMSGHTQVGIRHLDRSSRGLGIADKIFSLGGMRLTEDINRYVSVLAGKNHFNRQVKLIQRHKQGSRIHNRAKETLESFYKMDAEQISYLKEYGVEGAKVSGKSQGEAKQIQRKLDVIYQKANAMSHINTQGASLQLFMPKFAGGKFLKPLTLYKRMAFAATTNTLRNMKDGTKDIKAGKPSGMAKLAMAALGPYLAGEAMTGFYYYILGEDVPKENSSFFHQLKVKWWKGEFGGILSDVWSPMVDKDVARNTLNPAIISYVTNMWSHFTGVIAKEKSFDQFIKDATKQTFSIYNAYTKVATRKMNPYNRGTIKFQKLWGDFTDEAGPDMGKFDVNPDRHTKWDKDLRDAWQGDGPTPEFVDMFIATLLQTTHGYRNDWEGGVFDFDKAFDKAKKRLEKKITHYYNPNPAYFRDASDIETKRRQGLFLNWLSSRDPERGKEYYKELIGLGKEYDKRVSQFTSLYRKRLKEIGF